MAKELVGGMKVKEKSKLGSRKGEQTAESPKKEEELKTAEETKKELGREEGSMHSQSTTIRKKAKKVKDGKEKRTTTRKHFLCYDCRYFSTPFPISFGSHSKHKLFKIQLKPCCSVQIFLEDFFQFLFFCFANPEKFMFKQKITP